MTRVSKVLLSVLVTFISPCNLRISVSPNYRRIERPFPCRSNRAILSSKRVDNTASVMGFRLQFIFAFTSEIAFPAVGECFQRTIRRELLCSARRPRIRAPYREEVPAYLESVARECRAPPSRIFRRNEVHERRRNCGRLGSQVRAN